MVPAVTSFVHIYGLPFLSVLDRNLFFICLLEWLEGTKHGVPEYRHQAGVHIPCSFTTIYLMYAVYDCA